MSLSDKKIKKVLDSPTFNWIMRFIAVILSWRCNKYEIRVLRLIYIAIAYWMGYYYVGFYILYHWIFKYPCHLAFGTQGMLMR